MSTNSPVRRGPPARGFVLVGVVMMVLALTIIGISLYSLSGYEAQFFGRSLFDRQALYTASGGVELAKSLLSTPFGSPPEYRLSNVTRAIGREGIVSAVAWQESPLDSSGLIDWSRNVKVRIGVQVNGVSRTVQGEFSGSTRRNPYHHVFTCPGVIVDRNGEPNNRPTILVGKVWQTNHPPAGAGWTQYLDDDTRISFVEGEAPEPASAPFIIAHAPGVPAVKWWTWPPGTTYLDMDAGAGPDAAQYFYSATDESTTHHAAMSPYFDFYSQRALHVRVRGTAIWLVPRGIKLEGEFVVERLHGAASATLIMVVGPNERYAYPAPFTSPGDDHRHFGPWLEGGVRIEDPNTCLFLVSHGTARIQRSYDFTGTLFEAQAISLFAHRIEFEGPEYQMPRRDMTLAYPAWMEAIATSLLSRGLLPGAAGVASEEWTLQPGSWTTSPGLQ